MNNYRHAIFLTTTVFLTIPFSRHKREYFLPENWEKALKMNGKE